MYTHAKAPQKTRAGWQKHTKTRHIRVQSDVRMIHLVNYFYGLPFNSNFPEPLKLSTILTLEAYCDSYGKCSTSRSTHINEIYGICRIHHWEKSIIQKNMKPEHNNCIAL